MKVKIIELAKDEGLSTVVEVNKSLYEAMDCIGYTTKTFVDDLLDVYFTVVGDDNENLDDIFHGNLESIKELKNIKGWSYRAFGQIISINPVIIDCGFIVLDADSVLGELNSDCINLFVAFNISRLNIWVENSTLST